MALRFTLVLFGALVLCGNSSANSITLVTSAAALNANDSVTWGQLGSDNTSLSGPLSATSTNGATVNVSIADVTGTIFVNGGPELTPAIGLPFGSSDTVLSFFDENADNGTGPATFSTPAVFGMGAAIVADSIGQFTVQIQVNGASGLLGTVSESSDANGDPIFIGFLDTAQVVTSATFSMTSAGNINNETNYLGDFTVDSLLLNSQAPVAPEPSTLLLIGAGLLPLGLARLRGKS